MDDCVLIFFCSVKSGLGRVKTLPYGMPVIVGASIARPKCDGMGNVGICSRLSTTTVIARRPKADVAIRSPTPPLRGEVARRAGGVYRDEFHPSVNNRFRRADCCQLPSEGSLWGCGLRHRHSRPSPHQLSGLVRSDSGDRRPVITIRHRIYRNILDDRWSPLRYKNPRGDLGSTGRFFSSSSGHRSP